ncbi:hypothetical protein [Flavilitoribacter nigricans]|uniref:DUF4139 domain-containing protein n=1 Tax=Flavilitoribacter nigricans (strain ATCC 23147 / DSM 23189 / NBRC 102662 / NCIMB 1420 / SS-2) TaxID=1122177 RepID=A0A2D0N558_FLAN2|nr:hypothetical protein [Flavilitoribacter nigricans]PHN03516.1 hypothetical protein CRP01_26310 [Flavilitoribacter nigricans DSM 23189 = NBRC 102662]
MTKPILLLLSCISLTITTAAQDVQKDFRTSSISIFKNSTAFFIKSGTVTADAGTYRITDNLPPALFGTYWMNSPQGQLEALSSFVDTLETARSLPAQTIPEMLYANLGKRVILHVGKDEMIEGTVEALEEETPATGQIVTFRMDGRWRTFLLSEIRRIEFFEKPVQAYEHKKTEVKPVLEVAFTSEKKEQALDLMYLSNGLNWTPLYLMELTGEKRARLTLRAEVVNEIEDIKDTDVNFVVGVPNFSYADRLSPLIDFSSIQPRSMARGGVSNFDAFSNTLQTQTYGYAIEEDVVGNAPGTTSGLDGSAEEDLYFYTLEDMSIKKGGRGHYPVFTADIDIAHIYECNLPQNNAQKYAYRDEYLFSPNPNKVFHSIKVVNDTEYPFTTGAALVVKNGEETRPISQDRLNYTPIKGNSFVKLTEAPDVHIKQAEKAVKRQENARKTNRDGDTYYYDLLTIAGQIEVKNYKSQDIDLNIRRPILGELQESSIKWLKAERINTAGDLNKLTDVCWETSVDAGDELTITYTYEIYVPH